MNNKPTMMTYIIESPKQLQENIDNRKQLTNSLVTCYQEKQPDTIWIVASGSSFNASQCAKPFMSKYLHCLVNIIAPNTFNYYDHNIKENDLVVVISQSGCSTNSIDALKYLKAKNHLAIGITGNANSDFKDHADLLIDYQVGEEKVGYVTKGVVTLSAYLMLFALEAALISDKISLDTYNTIINEFQNVPQYHETMQAEATAFYEKHRMKLTSMQVLYSCGFLQGYGIACESALKIGETVQIPSFPYEAEEFIHGPNLQLTPNYSLFFIDDFSIGSERLKEIYHATRYVSDRSFIITNQPIDDNTLVIPFEIKEPLLSPLYILPAFQILAYRITDDLNKWNRHPLFMDFSNHIKLKSDKIKEIMPESSSAKRLDIK